MPVLVQGNSPLLYIWVLVHAKLCTFCQDVSGMQYVFSTGTGSVFVLKKCHDGRLIVANSHTKGFAAVS